jgi:hypothetical protein
MCLACKLPNAGLDGQVGWLMTLILRILNGKSSNIINQLAHFISNSRTNLCCTPSCSSAKSMAPLTYELRLAGRLSSVVGGSESLPPGFDCNF